MKKLQPRSFRPSLEALEDRRLMATFTAVGSAGTFQPFAFDSTLTAESRSTPGYTQVVVDGSDYDDVVEIVAFDPTRGDMEIRLQQWSGGTQIGGTRTVRFHGLSNLSSYYAVNADTKAGNDRIFNGTSAPMIVIGGADNDYFAGGSGVNYFLGGSGNDYFQGGGQRDVALGGEGDDTLYGYGGDDRLDGEAGNDRIDGGDGNDTISGGLNNDTLNGGAGHDSLFGDAGNDRLFGNEGQDWLYGGADHDYLDGGYKAYLYPGDGLYVADYLEGGLGADTFVRHKSFFSFNDSDVFAGYDSATGDRVEGVWHA